MCKFLIKIKSTWRRQITKQARQLILLYPGKTTRSCHWRCSIKKVFLRILQYPHKTTVLEFLFEKFASLKMLVKIQIQVFLQKFKTILKSLCQQIFLYCLKAQSLYCMTMSGFRVQVTELDFCF